MNEFLRDNTVSKKLIEFFKLFITVIEFKKGAFCSYLRAKEIKKSRNVSITHKTIPSAEQFFNKMNCKKFYYLPL